MVLRKLVRGAELLRNEFVNFGAEYSGRAKRAGQKVQEKSESTRQRITYRQSLPSRIVGAGARTSERVHTLARSRIKEEKPKPRAQSYTYVDKQGNRITIRSVQASQSQQPPRLQTLEEQGGLRSVLPQSPNLLPQGSNFFAMNQLLGQNQLLGANELLSIPQRRPVRTLLDVI